MAEDTALNELRGYSILRRTSQTSLKEFPTIYERFVKIQHSLFFIIDVCVLSVVGAV